MNFTRPSSVPICAMSRTTTMPHRDDRLHFVFARGRFTAGLGELPTHDEGLP